MRRFNLQNLAAILAVGSTLTLSACERSAIPFGPDSSGPNQQCDAAVCQKAAERIAACCNRSSSSGDGEDLCETQRTTADCQRTLNSSCSDIQAASCQVPRNDVPINRSMQFKVSAPAGVGAISVAYTDNNLGGTMPSYSVEMVRNVDPCGHTRGTVPGIELQIRNANGSYWGCDDLSRTSCDALLYLNNERVYGTPVGNPWTCDGRKLANCFIDTSRFCNK